ncbi:hypothetical protein F5Y16DRAFT_239580 [Xylariaceae sp. FL0255]|nr:hypothetical protein F5Y16DRAFT_239580 [Xylariaceae sp. FL0255]
MAQDQSLARLTLRELDAGDSFPERHILDKLDTKGDDEHHRSGRVRRSPGPPRPLRSASESPEGYELRTRYWEASDILKFYLEESKKPPEVWDFIYDPVCLPPRGMPTTPAIRRLGRMDIRRAWRRRSLNKAPDLSQTHIVEAIMTYERGHILDPNMRCDRCKDGEGASRDCVIVACIGEGVCSNCQYDGLTTGCNGRDQAPAHIIESSGKKEVEPGRSAVHATAEDYMIVLKLIEQMKQASGIGLKKDVSISAKAKRIEEAALQVAKAAREWGLREGSPSK